MPFASGLALALVPDSLRGRSMNAEQDESARKVWAILCRRDAIRALAWFGDLSFLFRTGPQDKIGTRKVRNTDGFQRTVFRVSPAPREPAILWGPGLMTRPSRCALSAHHDAPIRQRGNCAGGIDREKVEAEATGQAAEADRRFKAKDFKGALPLYRAERSSRSKLGDARYEAYALRAIGCCQAELGDDEAAIASWHLARALMPSVRIVDSRDMIGCSSVVPTCDATAPPTLSLLSKPACRNSRRRSIATTKPTPG